MRYDFIQRHSSFFPVRQMCETLDVSSSGYYAWTQRQPSDAQLRREQIAKEILMIHLDVKRRYGSPRIHAELHARGLPCSQNTVAKIMKTLGIQAISHRKFRVQTTDSNHSLPVAPNRLQQDFNVDQPNRVWLCDITYIPTQEGWLYLAAVEDLYSRRVVGWAMDVSLESRLVVDALASAVDQRFPGEDLVAHSDRGSQYASDHYQRLLAKHSIQCSMSRPANCYDNAPMESFFATLKKELVHHENYHTIEDAKASLFEYIEVFYNRQRRHSALGYLAPAEFESNDSP